MNSAGVGPASAELQLLVGCAGAPPAPAGLIQSVAGGVVTLAWNAVAGVSGYVVEVGLSPGVVNLSAPVGPGTTSVSGAAPSGTYFVRVRAQNACGLSGPSNQVVVVVP